MRKDPAQRIPTPLHGALTAGGDWAAKRQAVRELLDAGADPRALNEEGTSALHLASMFGDAATIEMLAHAGADLEAMTHPAKQRPAHLAALAQSAPALAALARLGADLLAADALGRTPVQLCAGIAEELDGFNLESAAAWRIHENAAALAEAQQLHAATLSGRAAPKRASL